MILNTQALFPLMIGGAIGTLLRFVIYQFTKENQKDRIFDRCTVELFR